MILPEPIQNLINAFSRLPGIGPKTASRLTFYLLRAPEDLSHDLAEALQELKTARPTARSASTSRRPGAAECEICANPRAGRAAWCAWWKSRWMCWRWNAPTASRGATTCCTGSLSPIEGIGPEDLKIRELMERVRAGEVREMILATNPSMEGDATALYLRQQLLPLGVRVTRLARGLPVGGDLEYADQNTLLRALSGRQEMG